MSTQVKIGIVSMTESSPDPEPIYLTINELQMLDSSTTELLPDHAALYVDVGANLASVLEQSGVDSLAGRLAVAAATRHIPVPTEVLRGTLAAIESHPSPSFSGSESTDYAAQVADLPHESAGAFRHALRQFMNDDENFAIATHFRLFRRAALDALDSEEDPEGIGAIRQELIDQAEQVDDDSGPVRRVDLIAVRDKAARLVGEAASREDSRTRLEVNISILNGGQTPITVSRFGVLEVDQEFLVPVERLGDENVLLLPGAAADVVFVSAEKGNNASLWDAIVDHRTMESYAVARFLLEPGGVIVRTDAVALSLDSEERDRATERLLAPNERLSLESWGLD